MVLGKISGLSFCTRSVVSRHKQTDRYMSIYCKTLNGFVTWIRYCEIFPGNFRPPLTFKIVPTAMKGTARLKQCPHCIVREQAIYGCN